VPQFLSPRAPIFAPIFLWRVRHGAIRGKIVGNYLCQQIEIECLVQVERYFSTKENWGKNWGTNWGSLQENWGTDWGTQSYKLGHACWGRAVPDGAGGHPAGFGKLLGVLEPIHTKRYCF